LQGYASNTLLTSFIVNSNLAKGQIYNFRLQAKNIYGWGVFSAVTAIATAGLPD